MSGKKTMTVKKTTKKVAKKTYPKKKTPPKSRRITLEDLAAVVADTEARMAKAREETERALREMSAEIIAEYKQTSALVREISKNIGSVGKDLGDLMEFIVIPKIRLAMNASGKHSFDNIQTDRMYKKIDELGEKKTITEVDILLFGKTEVMAVETKARPMVRDVKKHLERLNILRQNERLVGITDKTLFGAIVGAVVDDDVRKIALEGGLYVVKIREEEDKLEVEEPETCRTF